MRFLAPIDKGLHLRRVPLFGDLPPERLQLFVDYAEEELLAAGTVLQQAGAPVETVRIIVEGEVDCVLPGGKKLKLGPDSVTGVFEFFAGHATAAFTANGDVLTLSLATTAIRGLLEEHFDIVVLVFRGLGRSLIRSVASAPTIAAGDTPPELPEHEEHPAMGEVDTILALRRTMAFRGASVDGLSAVARVARAETFAKGAVLWTETDASNWLGIIVHGVVECVTSRRPSRFYFSEQATEAVGFLDTLAGDERWYRAVAHTEVVLLVVPKDALLDTLEDHFEMAFSCLSAFAAFSMEIVGRLREAPGLSPSEGLWSSHDLGET